MNWYDYPTCVPYGDRNYDVQLGGSHDMDVQTPLGTRLTFLLPGTITDVEYPSWGGQVCLKLDTPWNGVEYMAYLHIGYIEASLKVGMHVNYGDTLGLSGGGNSPATVDGVSLFVNPPFMSSQPQTGIALMRGPVYGSGDGWNAISTDLDPGPIIDLARKGTLVSNGEEHVGVPDGWTDKLEFVNNQNKMVLRSPNGKGARDGFRLWIITHEWDKDDQVEHEEVWREQLEEQNTSLGPGSRIVCTKTTLEWTQSMGVFEAYIGREFLHVLGDRDNLRTVVAGLQAQMTQLKAGLPVADIKNAIAAINTLSQGLTGLVQ